MRNQDFLGDFAKNFSAYSRSRSSKTSRKPQLIFPPEFTILETPNHKASVEISLKRIPKGSKALSPQSKRLEKNWNSRFNVTFSKYNEKFYTRLREYFDTPRVFDEKLNSAQNSVFLKSHRTISKKCKEKEPVWNLRNLSSSDWNEVTHKRLRNYFATDIFKR